MSTNGNTNRRAINNIYSFNAIIRIQLIKEYMRIQQQNLINHKIQKLYRYRGN